VLNVDPDGQLTCTMILLFSLVFDLDFNQMGEAYFMSIALMEVCHLNSFAFYPESVLL
jgi:hypothetical protein